MIFRSLSSARLPWKLAASIHAGKKNHSNGDDELSSRFLMMLNHAG
jgi:hypothetical protein